MAIRLTNRVQKLEDKTTIGDRHLVIPFCCFYSKENRSCDCKPYYTREPRVIGNGMADFYKEVNEPCKPMPKDAEPSEWGNNE